MDNQQAPFVVDTKGSCFICLGTQGSEQVSLKSLARFLKVNLKTVLNVSESSSSLLSSLPFLDDVGIEVSACGRCATSVSNFVERYKELEEARMRVQECVHTIHGLMEGADKNEDCVRQYRQRMMERSHPIELVISTNIIDGLRKETMLKCCNSLVPVIPPIATVKLLKLDENWKAQELPGSCENWMPILKREIPSAPNSPPIKEDVVEETVDEPKEVPRVSNLPITIRRRLVDFKRINLKQFKCLICGMIVGNWSRKYHKRAHVDERSYKPMFRNNVTVQLHKSTNHQQRKMPTSKPPPPPPTEIPKELANKEVDNNNQVQVADKSFKCTLCSDCHFQSKTDLESHVKDSHLTHIQKELNHAGNATITSGILEAFMSEVLSQSEEQPPPLPCPPLQDEQPPPSEMIEDLIGIKQINEQLELAASKIGPSQYQCPICQKVTSCPSKLKQHVRTHNDDKPHACTICGLSFSEDVYLEKHVLRCHRDEVFAQYKDENTSEEDFKIIVERVINTHIKKTGKRAAGCIKCVCKLCKQRYYQIQSCALHMVKYHTDEVGEILVEMQRKTALDFVKVTMEMEPETVNEEIVTNPLEPEPMDTQPPVLPVSQQDVGDTENFVQP